ncbi:hypothetical protein D3C86_2245590 [compost metagenome]
MRERRCVAEWLHRDPMADGEMRVCDEKQLGLRTGLFEPAELGQARRQETA